MIRWRRIRAKYAGAKCNACHRAVTVGDLIYWRRGAAPQHVDCETARLRASGCTACDGKGRLWGAPGRSRNCPSCDGTGSRTVQEFARNGGHPRKGGA